MNDSRSTLKKALTAAISGAVFMLALNAPADAKVRQIASADDIQSIQFLSPNNMPVKVLVVYSPRNQNQNFAISLMNIVADMHENGLVKPEDAFKVHVIPGYEMNDADYAFINEKVGAERVKKYVEFNKKFSTVDIWMQDWGEVGVIRLKSEKKPQTFVFDSNRGRDNAELPEVLANFWNSYMLKNPSNKFSGGDYGGNIEVTPDNILLIGDSSTPELREFLAQHGYKDRMAVLESDWLHVGHVDEYISVCPNPKAARGYTLIKANPRLALRLIKDASLEELKAIPYEEYRKTLIEVRNYLRKAEVNRATRNRRKLKIDQVPDNQKFGIAVLDYLDQSNTGVQLAGGHLVRGNEIEEFIKLNLTLANLIDTNVKAACNKISEVRKESNKPHSILSFPALFRTMHNGKKIAYLPGSVNQLIINNQLIVPDPKISVMRKNIARSASMIGLQANFVDSLPYHNLQGQIHCGTNVFRHPNKYFVKPR